MGARWQFASAAHRDQFAATPETFAPSFGGYCASGVSKGYAAESDPEVWRSIEGKLYLDFNDYYQRKWEQGGRTRIDLANKNWPTLNK